MSKGRQVVQNGDVVKAIVTQIEPYGVYVEHKGEPGLILIPELTWRRVSHPSSIAQQGEEVTCKVLAPADENRPHFMASIKQVHPQQNPWHKPDAYLPGGVFSGPVILKTGYGYFVEHPRGAMALLHIDDVPASTVFATGDTLSVVVTQCDVESQKIRVRLSNAYGKAV